MTVQAAKVDVEYAIKPEAITPVVDTSTWPLLLKNYDKCEIPLLLLFSFFLFHIYGIVVLLLLEMLSRFAYILCLASSAIAHLHLLYSCDYRLLFPAALCFYS